MGGAEDSMMPHTEDLNAILTQNNKICRIYLKYSPQVKL